MEKLIPLINEIQDILNRSNLTNTLQLPQLAVVGAQSTGKSSVLESIIGKDFLPRGQGIVTRCPIVLQLINMPKGSEEYAEFLTKKGQKFQDWDAVRSEIEIQQQSIAGNKKQISSNPITLKIYSPNVLDLTLVDLPGLTKIPVEDQPSDIERKIRDLVYAYVKNPNTVIMAVSAANTDLATSDSLQLAREVDPEGNRTIGVLTKLDLMEEGTDATEMLQGKLYKLKLGYIGVVCRGAKEKKSIQDGLRSEKYFFENHRVYKGYSEKCGIPYLVKVLNTTFIHHIKKTLPSIKDNINNLIQNKEYELSQYGDPGYELSDNNSKGFFILNLVGKFSKAYEDLINGVYLKTTTTELFGGARINYILNDVFVKCIEEINPFDVLSDSDIRTAIRNANGLNHSLFVPEMAFEILIKQQISRIQEPSIECSHQVYEELRKILFSINIPEITRFDNLSTKIYEVMDALLKRCLNPTDTMIKNLIEIELGHINTAHPEFINHTFFSAALEENKNEDLNKYEKKSSDNNVVAPGSKTDVKGQSSGGQRINQPQFQQIKEVKIVEENQSRGLLNNLFGGFGNTKKTQQVDEIDSKLDKLQISSKQSDKDKPSNSPGRFDNGILIERNEHNQFSRTYLPQIPNSLKVQEKPTRREQTEVETIKNLIVSYFKVVKRNICDSIPKSVITFLVNKTKNTCKNELVAALYKDDLYDMLLAENSYIAQSREECRKQLKSLKECLNILVEIDSKF